MLKIYNSLFREKQDFVPMRPGLGRATRLALGLAQRGAGQGAAPDAEMPEFPSAFSEGAGAGRGAGGRHSDADILEFLLEGGRAGRKARR
jgi:hypothetical protein